MKSQRHETWSTITPESTIPRPPPTPNTAERSPIATFTRSAGNSSRMIAKLSGKSAPPAPERIRNAISDQMFQAAAAPMQPARKRPRLTSSIRSLPYWSPSRPRIGVATAAETRKPVSTHVAQAVVAFRSSWKVGSAGKTIVCCSENAVPARVRIPSVTLWCCRVTISVSGGISSGRCVARAEREREGPQDLAERERSGPDRSGEHEPVERRLSRAVHRVGIVERLDRVVQSRPDREQQHDRHWPPAHARGPEGQDQRVDELEGPAQLRQDRDAERGHDPRGESAREQHPTNARGACT